MKPIIGHPPLLESQCDTDHGTARALHSSLWLAHWIPFYCLTTAVMSITSWQILLFLQLFCIITNLLLQLGTAIVFEDWPSFFIDFFHSRVRAAFDIALKFHRNIQQRDIEVGRNVGNWILRWLDRMKPSAQIHGPPEKLPHGPSMNMTNHGMKSSNPKTPGVQTSRNKESDLHLFSSSKNIWPKLPFSTIAMMMQHPRPAGTTTQYRHLETNGSDLLSLHYNRNGFDGVLRKDIMQWLLQKWR